MKSRDDDCDTAALCHIPNEFRLWQRFHDELQRHCGKIKTGLARMYVENQLQEWKEAEEEEKTALFSSLI